MTVIIDKTNAVLFKHDKVKDRSLAYAAQDIETIIKTGGRTPKDGGHLLGRTRHERISSGKYRVIAPVAYASYQERGMRSDGSHVVKKYSTPGTGKGWFNAAIHTVAKNFPNLIKQAASMEGF